MKGHRRGALLGLPMTLWTAVFVGIVLLYLLALSFFTPTGEGYGVQPGFTLENYRRLLSPCLLYTSEKRLRQSAAEAMRTGRGGEGLYACALALAEAKRGLKD